MLHRSDLVMVRLRIRFDCCFVAECVGWRGCLVVFWMFMVNKAASFLHAIDWKFATEQFVLKLPDKVFVHCSERNMAKLTLDGVDVMGERLAEEVLDVIKRKPDLRKM
ncbi:unnamed protein product [Fraxinus pennsylvanica]|uniref:DUF676 domain-containing protein n=1 Tax=Fraxinus pennsylvanica TaxID=56036 RepID=A0AAD2AGY2_9LAMI|nr:unnamed protein product [Fraxinus pennsylvanica]